jgi:hypothetical protein
MIKKIRPYTKSQFEKFYKTLHGCTGNGELDMCDYNIIKKIVKQVKPKSILELGFGNGSSASMWAAASRTSNIVSIDIWVKDHQNENAFKIQSIMRGGSFKLEWADIHHILTDKNYQNKYDLVFVDGDPYKVEFEVEVAMALNPKYLVLNNWFHPQHREEVQLAANIKGLKLENHFTSECGIALLSNPYYTDANNI